MTNKKLLWSLIILLTAVCIFIFLCGCQSNIKQEVTKQIKVGDEQYFFVTTQYKTEDGLWNIIQETMVTEKNINKVKADQMKSAKEALRKEQ